MLAVARSAAAREQRRSTGMKDERRSSSPFPNDTSPISAVPVSPLDALRGPGPCPRRDAAGPARLRRIALSVWQGIDRHLSPGYSMTPSNGGSACLAWAAIFALGDAAEASSAADQSGFRDVDRPSVARLAFPHPRGVLGGRDRRRYRGLPRCSISTRRGRQAVTAAIQVDMTDPLREATVGDHVVVFHAHIVRARC